MKPFAAQSYYELLEVSVSASPAEIRAAWERLNRMYADDQLALYGLANAGSAAELRKRLKEAMEVLTDDELRGMYDEEIGLPPRNPLQSDEPPATTQQLEMGDLLAGADHSATHPVAFTYEAPRASPQPPAQSWVEAPKPSPQQAKPPVPAPPPPSAPPSAPPAAPPPVEAAPPPVVEALAPPPAAVVEAPPPAPPPPAPAPAAASAPSAPKLGARPSSPRKAVVVTSAPRPPRIEAEHLAEEAAIALAGTPKPSAPPPPAPSAPRLPDPPADAEYNGELLRQRRNAMGYTLAAVADRTRIGAKHLENVEADRYDALPATVYLRGILMSLAKELRLDGLKVSRSYLALVDKARASKG